ncbi:hypothetical protein Lal_00031641 [Lupinus albus]|nr:hypothetical protein Lal_00031641 [Lupinus albus]
MGTCMHYPCPPVPVAIPNKDEQYLQTNKILASTIDIVYQINEYVLSIISCNLFFFKFLVRKMNI